MVLAGKGHPDQSQVGRGEQQWADGAVEGAVGDVEDAFGLGGGGQPFMQPVADGQVVGAGRARARTRRQVIVVAPSNGISSCIRGRDARVGASKRGDPVGAGPSGGVGAAADDGGDLGVGQAAPGSGRRRPVSASCGSRASASARSRSPAVGCGPASGSLGRRYRPPRRGAGDVDGLAVGDGRPATPRRWRPRADPGRPSSRKGTSPTMRRRRRPARGSPGRRGARLSRAPRPRSRTAVESDRQQSCWARDHQAAPRGVLVGRRTTPVRLPPPPCDASTWRPLTDPAPYCRALLVTFCRRPACRVREIGLPGCSR